LVRLQALIQGLGNQVVLEGLIVEEGVGSSRDVDVGDVTVEGGVDELLLDDEVEVVDDVLLERGNLDSDSLLELREVDECSGQTLVSCAFIGVVDVVPVTFKRVSVI
jgi:hypothetical protein